MERIYFNGGLQPIQQKRLAFFFKYFHPHWSTIPAPYWWITYFTDNEFIFCTVW